MIRVRRRPRRDCTTGQFGEDDDPFSTVSWIRGAVTTGIPLPWLSLLAATACCVAGVALSTTGVPAIGRQLPIRAFEA